MHSLVNLVYRIIIICPLMIYHTTYSIIFIDQNVSVHDWFVQYYGCHRLYTVDDGNHDNDIIIMPNNSDMP